MLIGLTTVYEVLIKEKDARVHLIKRYEIDHFDAREKIFAND
jgi:hypothetical protein